jgi:hypothetical protein
MNQFQSDLNAGAFLITVQRLTLLCHCVGRSAQKRRAFHLTLIVHWWQRLVKYSRLDRLQYVLRQSVVGLRFIFRTVFLTYPSKLAS